MDKELITDKGNKSSKEISDFLRRIADKIDEGSLTLSRGQETVELQFPREMGFRFKVKDDISRSGTQRKVQIGFRWRTDEEGRAKQTDELVLK